MVAAEVPTETHAKAWNAVLAVIDELEEDASGERFVVGFIEWDLAVRMLRRAEINRMVLADAEPSDHRAYHECLRSLLAIGERIERMARQIEPDRLRLLLGMSHGDVEACVWEIQQRLREGNQGTSPERIKEIQTRIFGAAT